MKIIEDHNDLLRNMELLRVHTRVLTCDKTMLYLQQGRELLVLDTVNCQVAERISLAAIYSWMEDNVLLARLFRLGVHALCVLPGRRLVFVHNRRICEYDPLTKKIEIVFHITRGSRPLFLCHYNEYGLCFGEYFDNPDRQAVNIYASRDMGKHFEVAYTFPADEVRHVHGVFFDPYTRWLWVTTGDADKESGIWVTDDDFAHLNRIVGESQRYRAVHLLFTEDCLYFGSDTPFERNSIYRMERASGKIDSVQTVPGSVFFGCKVGDNLFFSTAAEKSEVNTSRDPTLWGSPDGKRWQCIAKFKKDIWPMKLFQLGQILFPAGENQTGRLWFTPLASEHDQTLCCIDVAGMDWDRGALQ